jgi:pimeloyl-ACP methyl ester carboxylesterase
MRRSYVLLLLLGFTVGCMNRLFLFPSTNPIFTYNQTQKMLPLGDGVLEIRVSQYGPPSTDGPNVFILEFVGNGSRAEHGSTFLSYASVAVSTEVWVVNYPGYGKSTGPAKLRSIPLAAEVAYREITKAANGRPILLAGTSMGTTAALYLAARYEARAVMLQNPPPLQRLVMGRFGWWNLWLVAAPVALWLPSELNSLKNAAKAKAPLLLLMAEQDNVVPMRFQYLIAEAYAGPTQVIEMPSIGHNDGLTPTAVSALTSFLGEHIH